MPATLQTPGLYYEPVQPIAASGPLARGDVAAFVGLTRRGPLFRPVRVGSLREAAALFGDAPRVGYLMPALKGFFETGAAAAYIVRVADPDAARAAAADLGGGWRAEARFQWPLIDPRRLARTRGAPSPAWAALVETALQDGPGEADPGAWGARLAVRIARAPLAQTPAEPADARSSRVASLAGLAAGAIVEVTQGATVGVLMVEEIDAARQLVRWTAPLAGAGLDPSRPARLASVEFRVDVLLDGRLAERFAAVSPNPAHAASAAAVLGTSRYVGIDQSPGDPADPATWPHEGDHPFDGGRDGVSTVIAKHYLAALEALTKADEVALVAAPDLVLAPADPPAGIAPAGPPPTDCCDLTPRPLGRVDGLVVNGETGRPVVGARVEAAGVEVAAGTDAAGRFTLSPTPLALLAIRVVRADYEEAELLLQASETPPTPDMLAAARIELAPIAAPRALAEADVLLVQQAMATGAGPWRVAVIDPPHPRMTPDAWLTWRSKLGDSARLAFFTPWIVTPDGDAVPPCGHVCGALAAGELAVGIHRAPANIQLRWAAALTAAIDDDVQAVLNPAGVNAIRAFPGRGIRAWGTRTLSSEPEWRFLPARRVVDAIERTLEAALQWVVFEPNALATRQAVTVSVTALLDRLWRMGVLAGASPAAAFRVKCDADNNPDDAITRGELVVEVAVAPANPFEFVVFSIAKALDALSVAE